MEVAEIVEKIDSRERPATFKKQRPAQRSIKYMNTQQLPSSWQLGDKVQVVFPGNGKLQGKIIKVSFDGGREARYDVEVPFDNSGEEHEVGRKGFFRLHGVDQYFLSYTQEEWDKMRDEERVDEGKSGSMFETLGNAMRPH